MQSGEGPLSSDEVPQANVLERVVQRVRARVHGGVVVTSGAGDHARDVHYYLQAARILGLLDDSGDPTAEGIAVTRAAGDALSVQLVAAFSRSRAGARWISWSEAASLGTVDPDSAEDFLRACSALSPATARRRAGTLRHWWRTLFMPSRPPSVPPLDRVADLPRDEREVFERLLRAPLEPVTAIWARIDSHIAVIARISHVNEFVGLAEARALAQGLRALVGRIDEADDGACRLWQAAVHYFLLVEDADTDLDIGGIDDDLAVFNAVARHLGHPDLCIIAT